MRRLPFAIAAVAALLATCSSPTDPAPVSATRARIELSEHGTIFTLATALTSERTRAARLKELAARASGAIFSLNVVAATGAPLLATNGTRVRGSCGATFISPSYAVTAAHCVNGASSDMQTLSIETYRPTPALDPGFLRATPLTGTFPAFDHPRLEGGDGYFADRYACTLVSRCSTSYGGTLNCDAAVASAADAALVRCDGAPGAKYGYVDLAAVDEIGAVVFMPWKHEVYDVPRGLPQTDDRFAHYVSYAAGAPGNYHYFGLTAAGVESNQLLPLISPDFADRTPHRKVGANTGNYVTTDLFGCHGSSGSGVLQEGERGPWQLLGPAVFGNGEHGAYLCNHSPALDGASREPGGGGLAYGGLAATRHLHTRNLPAIRADCDPLPGSATVPAGPGALDTAFACARDGLGARAENAPLAASLRPTAGGRSPYDDLEGPVIRLGPSQTLTVNGFALDAGTRYRVGFHAWAPQGCFTQPCPSVAVGIGGRELAAAALDRDQLQIIATPAAGLFAAEAGGATSLTITARILDGLEVGGLVVRREDQTNTFDTAAERREAVMYVFGSGGPMPARFVGDGRQGFAARILDGERLLLTRQAIAPGHRWAVRFTVAAPAAGAAAPRLTCGIVELGERAVAVADCSSGTALLDDRAGTSARAAFFIETEAGAGLADVDDVLLVSDALPDGDGDGTPDIVDKCPMGPVPAGETLRLELAATFEQTTCLPEPTMVMLTAPRAANACEAPVLVGRVSTVNGKTIAAPAVAVSNDRVLLPLGTHTVVWEARDRTGRVHATASQAVSVVLTDGPSCCGAGRLLTMGTAAADALVVGGGGAPACVLAGDGADLVGAGGGGDLLSGGAGGDYLGGGGGGDVLLGGDGDDYLGGGAGGALAAYAGAGNDTVHARFAASARIFGGPGADVLVGSEGDDAIYPGAGTVLVLAGGGDDTVTIYDPCELGAGMRLAGGAGNDTLISPVAADALAAAGVEVTGFENVTVDSTGRYLSQCF